MPATLNRQYVHAEIGATAVHPADVTMRRGIIMGYITIVCAYLAVSITGAGPAPATMSHSAMHSSRTSSKAPRRCTSRTTLC